MKKIFDRPFLEEYSVTSNFGERNLFGKKEHHGGVDFKCPLNTVIVAPTDGKVADIITQERGGLQLIFHAVFEGKNFFFLFAHLSKTIASIGDKIAKGAILCLTGGKSHTETKCVGRSTGPHLHLELWTPTIYPKNKETDQKNPLDFIRLGGNDKL